MLEFNKIVPQDDRSLQDAMLSALQKIRDKAYAAELLTTSVQKINSIGIVVDGKRV